MKKKTNKNIYSTEIKIAIIKIIKMKILLNLNIWW